MSNLVAIFALISLKGKIKKNFIPILKCTSLLTLMGSALLVFMLKAKKFALPLKSRLQTNNFRKSLFYNLNFTQIFKSQNSSRQSSMECSFREVFMIH